MLLAVCIALAEFCYAVQPKQEPYMHSGHSIMMSHIPLT